MTTSRFEHALPFHGGLARVYENGKPVYIDKSGHKAFDDVYLSVRTFDDHRAIVVDSQYHTGVIDTRGKMIVEPAITRN